MTYPLVTTNTEQRIAHAITMKAARLAGMLNAPFGFAGDIGEFGVATVQADRLIVETLFGLRAVDLADIDLTTLVTTDDVIRYGKQTDPATYPTDLLPGVQRALDAAVDWVDAYLNGPFGVA